MRLSGSVMPSLKFVTTFSFLVLCGSPMASAAAPAAPTNLTVKALGVNSFQVSWKDNSKNELGWEIRVALKGGTPQRFVLIPSPNITTYTVTTNDLPGKELVFQMTAYNGVAGNETLSKLTPIVTVKALSSNTFNAPTMLLAKAIDDGRIQLTWTDNSTSEGGYQIESRIGRKKWVAFGNVGPGITFKILTTGFPPGETRSFRVRAFKGAGTFTSYSNIATATTKAFQAPSNLIVTALAEGSFSFKWTDRSSAEIGFEIESKSGTGNFASLGTVAANATKTDPVAGFSTSTPHQFRIRAFRQVGTAKVYSGYSNTVAITSSSLNTPATFVSTGSTDKSVTFTWVDKSARETGYEILYRVVGAPTFASVLAPSNAQTFTVGNLTSGALHEFRLRAVINGFFGNRIDASGYRSLQARTKEGFVGIFNPPVIAGNSFLFPIQISLSSALTNLTVTGLPAGLTYNSSTKAIVGKLTSGGSFTATLVATFSDGSTATRSLFLNSIMPAPVIARPFSAVSVAVAAAKTVSVAGKFSDPDTASAARVSTVKGTFDIILFPFSTPQTVDNFLDYTDASQYDDSFFHRSPPSFVIQGGGYKHTAGGGFTEVTKFSRVLPNEPGLSNVRGTVAMAKIGGLPDSATSEWFVNVNDNSSNLDAQNGGFTVFGRVPAAGMVIVDQINALPTHDYTVTIGAGTRLLEDVPVNAPTAPEILDPAQLVKITSIDAAPILIYQAVSQNTGIATATLTGTDISIIGIAAGSTTIQVTATDLDGNTVAQNIAVTVP